MLDIILHRNEAGALRLTTTVKHFSVHMVQASLRQMNVEGTEHTCAKLEQAELVYP